MSEAMALFHPQVRLWFEQHFGAPTDVQREAWPRIAAGENLLITAPTGSGKTLTAFLWALDRFIAGDLSTGATRVLYVSPLKALGNDIRRNLLGPLEELAAAFAREGLDFPPIRVLTRSGDTEADERRRMLRHPPEILITTPESLNLLLSSHGGRSMLTGIRTVILDEIHDVVSRKRGVYLMSAVERLVPMCGEFQRIALSATVNPLDTVARYVAGYVPDENNRWTPRSVGVIAADAAKRYEVSVRYPEAAAQRGADEKIWDTLAEDCLSRIRANRSTLLFVNSRALCEKMTWKINEAAGEMLAWAHHGSLSKELRFEVEQKLKAGRLAAIVATGTLEMGIDIGDLDEVILIQAPDAISSAVQRVGRAGHGVGEVSVATIYPTHPADFLEAAVLARAIRERDIEPLRTVECPLDVLAQVIISMTGIEPWDLDELFVELRRSTPYHNLTRNQFDLVINMLAGRYGGNHIRELKPKVAVDRMENRITARPGALLSLYLSGGVIPDRGYFQLRHEADNARIGELDEEFVWESQVGQVFSFGTQHWQVRKITHNDVFVAPGKSAGVAPPFWKAEPLSRDFHFAARIGELLEDADAALSEGDFEARLMDEYCFDATAARELRTFLIRQQTHCNAPLPHRHHLLAETVSNALGRAEGRQLVLHTGWGARVNRPLAMALEAGWQEAHGEHPEIYVSNRFLVMQMRDDVDFDDIFSLVPADRIEALLRQRLEGSGFFGARFRENAGFALLLSRGRFNERKPLWMSRLQSKRLLTAVMNYDDFPILLETWRTCLKDEFDLDNLRLMLDEIARGDIRVTEVRTQTPSPFAQTAAWGQINTYMYTTDEPAGNNTSRLRPSLLEEVVFNPGIRPAVPDELVDDFIRRRQRLAPGYAPEGDAELVEWVKERTAIPVAEWPWDLPEKLTVIDLRESRLIVAVEDADAIGSAWRDDGDADTAAMHLANWLQYYGPQTAPDIAARLGIEEPRLATLLASLANDEVVIVGQLISDDERDYWCDAANYEALLRLMRQGSRKTFDPLECKALPLFFHHWQTNFSSREPVDRLFEIVERFRCLPLPAGFWESDLLPSRLADYDPSLMDSLLQQGNLLWNGAGEQRIAFCFTEDMDLMPAPEVQARMLLPEEGARYEFGLLLERSGKSAHDLSRELWEGVWRGEVTNDSMAALRKGVDNGFTVPDVAKTTQRRRSTRRGGFARWRGAAPFAGGWYRIAYPDAEPDLIEQEELNKDRVRVLLDRYGLVFRELVSRELPEFGWSRLFRSIRLMELSGELVSGYFVQGIPGPQFASAEAWRMLQRPLPADDVFWINATDPVSLCGAGLDIDGLPRRLPGNYLVYHGDNLVMVVERNGKSLHIMVAADNEHLGRYFDVLRHLLYRRRQPLKKIDIEEINRQPVTGSSYLDALKTAFDVIRDHKTVYIQREI